MNELMDTGSTTSSLGSLVAKGPGARRMWELFNTHAGDVGRVPSNLTDQRVLHFTLVRLNGGLT
ncbi:hypothetical protein BH686_01960 [Rhodococcus erythropolis]|nr:hypothetical protein BH686_01960 [Rhodococcus erythropolis]